MVWRARFDIGQLHTSAPYRKKERKRMTER